MNKYQKELFQISLDDEKKVLNDLKKTYKQAEQDINEKIELFKARLEATDDESMRQSIIYQKQYQEALKKQISAILDELSGNEFDTISGYIEHCYEDGFIGTLYEMQKQNVPLIFPIDQEQVVTAVVKDTKLSKSLYSTLVDDVNQLKKKVQGELSRGLAQNYSYADIARNIQHQTKIGYNRAARIAQTEGHRVQQAAKADAQLKAKDAGADVVKQWDATLDGKTRPQHRTLDGQIREIGDPFEVDGYEAQYPGEFGVPWLDINCRCTTLTRARWVVENEESFTKRDNEIGHLVEIKSENYEDFKKKYGETLYNFDKTIYNRVVGTDGNELYRYVASDDISKLNTTDEIRKYFSPDGDSPIDESFELLSINSQREVAEGIAYMKETFGLSSLPKKISATLTGGDYGVFKTVSRQLNLNKAKLNRKLEEAFPTMVHELAHYLDTINGDFSNSIVTEAFKRLKIRRNSREAQMLILAITGRFDKYSTDPAEIFAYSLERNSRSKNNKLTDAIEEILKERLKK